ncbi:ribose-phosphate pyrophosphokinase [Chelativorans sp. AA-79]|uniref:ribose-phosphate diphosphokinase n=1 Tax=Chelativorans sp. AA-79 TaxID=3028735 RepID=UPI0023F8F0BD|nr:ribose-phosphate pyrophosphokinase [Chelativorans sp. AA-79]WEX10728.1 ribose-phosphate pyrophosphokinase [Chelativorans sp. AA-79]
MRLFALNGSEHLGGAVAKTLGATLDPHEERDFEDGEHKARPLVCVRGEDVYVLHSLAGGDGASANDRLMKLLFFLATCREHGAERVTAVAPYLAYSRKDRQTKARDPVTTRYVAQLFEAVGTDRIITLDVHNISAFQNAFRCETIHVDTRRLFVPVVERLAEGQPVTILSPDGGGVKRAQLLKEHLETDTDLKMGFGFLEKRRSRGVVSGDLFAGEVDGTVVFVVDDMISTGGTMLRAATACRERGAKAVHAIATHGLFSEGVEALFDSDAFDNIVVTDSLPAAAQAKTGHPSARLEIVSAAGLIADALKRLRDGGSICDLLGVES